MQQYDISLAVSRQEIDTCFHVMAQLRTHLTKSQFVEQVIRQQQQGYQLARLLDGAEIKALAGFRITEGLHHGKFMYVDDLVTDESQRSMGYGKFLLDWLIKLARNNNCQFLDLDSGVQRFDAHRFYLNNRMNIVSHHFSLKL